MKVADFFGVLKVSRQATLQEIRNAYVSQKNRWNPETYVGKVDDKVLRKISVIYQKIIAAFTVLSDEGSHARYLKHIEDSSKEGLSQIVKAEMYFLHGEKDLKNGEYVQAKEHFEMARKLNPKEPEYLLHVGWLTFLVNPDDIVAMRDSLKIIKEALTLNPRLVKGFIYLAILARKANQLNYAMKYLKKALTIEPGNRQAQKELGELKSLFQNAAVKQKTSI
jgi:tetratricopeptide (TPR) repeat protein